MRRYRSGQLALLTIFCLAVATVARAQGSNSLGEAFAAVHSGGVKILDLTHALDDQSPFWPEGSVQSPFHATSAATFEHDGYFARAVSMPEHFGTHMDAPAHFDRRGLSVDRLPVERFLVAAVVVDIGKAVKSSQDYRLTVADLDNWVKLYGAMPRGCAVLVRTGWSSRWPSQKNYINQDTQGVLHFPGLSVEAARYLLDRARPVAIGIDTASIDYGPSKDFEVHRMTMAAGLYHLENLANLERVPATGTYLIALPLKLRGGSGSPARVLALYPSR